MKVCLLLLFGCTASFTAAQPPRTVHMVWMNHLDVGYTNNIASVLNIYCECPSAHCIGVPNGVYKLESVMVTFDSQPRKTTPRASNWHSTHSHSHIDSQFLHYLFYSITKNL